MKDLGGGRGRVRGFNLGWVSTVRPQDFDNFSTRFSTGSAILLFQMTPGSVAVLMSAVVLVCIAVLQVGCALALWYTVAKLRPQERLRADLMLLEANQSALEAQVTKLRTQKAGARSAAKKAEAQAAAPDSADDPLLEGLDEETRGLFM